MVLYVVLSWIGMRIFHTYAGVIRYSSFVDLQKVAMANGVSAVLAIAVHYLVYMVPDAMLEHLNGRKILSLFAVATLLMWLVRVIVKVLYDIAYEDKDALRVLIYGVKDGGVGLAKNIRTQKPVKFLLKGFIAHEGNYQHHRLLGEQVFQVDDKLPAILADKKIEAVLISPLRNAEFRNDERLQDMLIDAGIKIFMSQDAKEVKVDTNGNGSGLDFSDDIQLKEVSVEDLLPRAQIKVDMELVGKELTGKRILITGSAGSIGSEMVRQVAVYKPAAMMLIDQAETPEHDIRLMMANSYPAIKAETIVTSICNEHRMNRIFSDFRPDYVFHAAAYKHVPMMEDNPSEAVQNNVYGTKVIADLSVKYGVKKFVMVSTDKAVNPTNVMGCSKRICEIYVQALDKAVKDRKLGSNLEGLANPNSFVTVSQMDSPSARTQFVTTRFGNVLGSNGSVIPLFQEQIRKGGPVTVTDPKIIRYFMLIPEACKLVLEAGTRGHGGEIFVFDMGKPVKIADLAKRMINLSGAKNVKIKYTGLRAGEKLYEEVLSKQEDAMPSFHDKIRIAKVREYEYDEVNKEIEDLIAVSKQYDDMATVRKMKEIVPEYKSNNSVYDVLDKQNE